MERTEVFIVGAGPSGLVAAVLLSMHGLPFRIVDKKTTFSENSRAAGIQARSLEVFEQIGVADAFLAQGRIAYGADFHTPSGIVRIDIFGAGWLQTAYPFILLLEQSQTEKILYQRLQSLGQQVEWEREVVGVEPGDDSVIIRLRVPGGTEQRVAARWIVAADGASSSVRGAVNVPFTGSTYEQRFAVADVKAVRGRMDLNHLHINLNKSGFVLLVPLARSDVYRLASSYPPAFARSGETPDFEDIQSHVNRVFPGGLQIADPQWFSTFRIHSRSVSRFRHGRVFFVGDAAHIHSPVGGQGMNTGVQDAHALAWRLALVAKGVLPEHALNTYHEERYPIAQALLKTTDRVFRMIDEQSILIRIPRVYFYPYFVKLVSLVPWLRRWAASLVSQIAIRYRRGLLIPDGDFPSSAPEPGGRFPYVIFTRDGERWSTPSLIDYRYHHLLLLIQDGSVLAEAEHTRTQMEKSFLGSIRVHIIVPERKAKQGSSNRLWDEVDWRDANAPAAGAGTWSCSAEAFPWMRERLAVAYLVRPDGYVGLRKASVHFRELEPLLRQYFSGNRPTGLQPTPDVPFAQGIGEQRTRR